jgi:hypothetical protein
MPNRKQPVSVFFCLSPSLLIDKLVRQQFILKMQCVFEIQQARRRRQHYLLEKQ